MTAPSLRRFPPPYRRRGGRSGFTIVELLLALAILVTLAALVVPSFSAVLADRQLSRAGDQLRVEMMQARLVAMRTGRTYLLELKPGSYELRLRPWVDMNDMTETLDQTGGSAALLTGGNLIGGTMQEIDLSAETKESKLPEDTQTAEVRVQSSPRSFLIDSQVQAEAGEGWGQPILFYPDGTSSTAAVTLSSPGVGRVVVLLRGLTGEASVTDLFGPAESGGGT